MSQENQTNFPRFSYKIIKNSTGIGYELKVSDCPDYETADNLNQQLIAAAKAAIVTAAAEIPNIGKVA